MQVYPNRFSDVINKGLQPFYLIFGDEPQQKLSAIETLRNQAKQQGFEERQTLVADSQFSWSSLIEATQTLSLFATKQYIELELPTGKPGTEGSKVLSSLAAQTNPDVLLMIHGAKIGKDVQNSKWFKALDQQGTYVPCYPLEGRQLDQWISQYMQSIGLTSDHGLVQLINDNCEGNLLAARQEIDKLQLLYPQGVPSLELAEKAVINHSRFSVFQLVDVLLSGNAQKSVKMLYRLENEGIEPTIILWALVRECQTLISLRFAQSQGQNLHKLWTQHRIWKNRQGLYLSALQRLDDNSLQNLQDKLGTFDQALKQSQIPRPYVELSHLCLMFMPMPLERLELAYD